VPFYRRHIRIIHDIIDYTDMVENRDLTK
jgi:hypothetical protein